MCPKVVLIAVSVASLLVPASAEETLPYALRTDKLGDTYVPSLGDIMGATQLRHFKLWYAGKLKNWELAGYELGQIEDSFANAARGYQNIPIENIIIVEKPLQALDSAIKDKDGEHFDNAFTDLTAACNSCHQAGQVGFIVIQTPTASPFSNQDFEPKQR
jgi:hypothetical protein